MKKENGISLISLIITIIVMIILAVVALSMVTGEGNVIQNADTAVTATNDANDLEQIQIAQNASKVSGYDTEGTKKTLVDIVNEEGWGTAVYDSQRGVTVVTMTDSGKKYDVYEDGTITENTIDTSWYEGEEGTTDFTIATAADLEGFAYLVNGGDTFSGKTITLNANIDLGGKTWTPIKNFAGKFDGNNHTISNFALDGTKAHTGFFDTIEGGAEVSNLTISNVDATVGAYRIGIFVRNMAGISHNVKVKDVTIKTTASTAWVGGFTSFMNWGWTTNCTVENVTVDAANGADLIAGFACILQKNSNMVYDNCDVKNFKVNVTDTDSGECVVGGFVAQTQRGWEYPEVKNTDVTGLDITAVGKVYSAGFVTIPGAHQTASNCTVQGTINATGVTSSTYWAGGFLGNCGWNADLGQMGHKITNCSANVNITSGGAAVGGFVGSVTNLNNNSMYATFTNCKATGSVTNTNGAAGAFAGVADRGVYTNCIATGAVSGTTYAGGFIGYIKDVTPKYDSRYPAGTRDYLVDQITISGCTGSSSVTGPTGKTASIVGYIDAGTDVTLTSNNFTGTESNKAS